MKPNKRKIINDPVYGFITIPFDIVFDLIEHPYFQRLRRIKQLGLTHFVYPGAMHTRFQHAIGAVHLMTLVIENLRNKGVDISNEEAEAVTIAILLHDIGHGPYSHTLEHCLVAKVSHEDLSEIIMDKLNEQFNGKLNLAIKIFKNKYKKKFLHQLVSGQLDVDRLDYLNRDSFFTGVYEGVIGYDRIIKMITIKNDAIVVEEKGIYSIEKFIIARRIMYWQVYLHKTVIAAEQMLVQILRRAKDLAGQKVELFTTPALKTFLYNNITKKEFNKTDILEQFIALDDFDIFTSVKVWANHPDQTLAYLCKSLINRELFKVVLQKNKFKKSDIEELKNKVKKKHKFSDEEVKYLVFSDSTTNSAYNMENDQINILPKDGMVLDIANASDQLNISQLAQTVVKYYLCYPKDIY